MRSATSASTLVLDTGSDTYETFITAEPLIGDDGRPAAARALWAEKLILISGMLPPQSREETWFHEAVHVFDYVYRCGNETEARTDWIANVTRNITKQYKRQGGRKTLEAMVAVAGVAPAYVIASEDCTDLLRKYRFPALSDEEYRVARKHWESRGFDPWRHQFNVRVLETRYGPQIKLVLTIEGLRAEAHRTNEYAGCEEVEYVFGDDPNIPEKAVFTGYRCKDGRMVKFVGEAYWRDCFGTDLQNMDPLVQMKPRVCLATCAEANFLRRAFADETKDLYVREELMHSPTPERQLHASAGDDGDADDRPSSSTGLHLRLIDLGFKTEAARRKLIRDVAAQYGPIADGQEPAFYARVVQVAKLR